MATDTVAGVGNGVAGQLAKTAEMDSRIVEMSEYDRAGSARAALEQGVAGNTASKTCQHTGPGE